MLCWLQSKNSSNRVHRPAIRVPGWWGIIWTWSCCSPASVSVRTSGSPNTPRTVSRTREHETDIHPRADAVPRLNSLSRMTPFAALALKIASLDFQKILNKWVIPRLCRGDSSSLTFTAVSLRYALRLVKSVHRALGVGVMAGGLRVVEIALRL